MFNKIGKYGEQLLKFHISYLIYNSVCCYANFLCLKIHHGWLKNLPRLAENPQWLAEKPAMAGGQNFATNGGTTFNGQRKIHNGWQKNPPLLAEILASAEKFRAMVCDNFPGKFRRRQVVVLRYALSGLEFSGILFQCTAIAQRRS
jgi:hypothetical protein